MSSEDLKYSSVDTLTHFIVDSKMEVNESENYTSEESSVEVEPCKLLVAIKPLLTVGKIFGICPLEYTKNDSMLILKRKSWWYVHSVCIFILVTIHLGFQVVSLGISIVNGRSVLDIVGQSQWLHAGIISFTVTLFVHFRSDSIIKIYNDWSSIESDVEHLFMHNDTFRSVRTFQIIYGILTLVSVGCCGLHVNVSPNYPAYLLYYIKDENGKPVQFSIFVAAAYSILLILITTWCWVGFTLLEVTLSIYAVVFKQCMNTILAGISEKFEEKVSCAKMQTKDDEVLPNKDNELPVLSARSQTSEPSAIQTENYNRKSGIYYRTPIRPCHPNAECLIGAIKDLQKIASLTSEINSTFGPVLLIDFAILILMVCGLIFLPIKYFQEFDIYFFVVFAGNGICFLSRLIILVICLGNVFPAGTSVNTGLAKVLTHFNLENSSMNPILAHLSVFSSNPICFTAWDFFPITRGTLLGAFSLITTYLVILIQWQ